MAVEFYIHKMSEHMESAEIVQWRVHEGDHVDQFQVILEVMTDKVTAEVESPASGVIRGVRPGAVEGATVRVGEPICYIAAPGESVPALPPLSGPGSEANSSEPARGRASLPSGSAVVTAQPEESARAGDGPRASPAARALARQMGVDLGQIAGTGPQGRITEEDVRRFAGRAG